MAICSECEDVFFDDAPLLCEACQPDVRAGLLQQVREAVEAVQTQSNGLLYKPDVLAAISKLGAPAPQPADERGLDDPLWLLANEIARQIWEKRVYLRGVHKTPVVAIGEMARIIEPKLHVRVADDRPAGEQEMKDEIEFLKEGVRAAHAELDAADVPREDVVWEGAVQHVTEYPVCDRIKFLAASRDRERELSGYTRQACDSEIHALKDTLNAERRARAAAPPNDAARVAAEKAAREIERRYLAMVDAAGEDAADFPRLMLPLRNLMIEIILESLSGVAAPNVDFREGVAACVSKLRELASFNDEYGQKCDQAGQQDAAASRFSRANALHDAILELQPLALSATTPIPARQEVEPLIWLCSCGDHNGRERKVCRRCGLSKPIRTE